MTTFDQYKQEGNRLFHIKKYEEAIKQYTKAINKGPSSLIPILYSNRALCYLKLKQYEKAIVDCKSTIENNSQSVKANFFLGQSEMELEKYDDAITHLARAHDLAKQQRQQLHFGDDITCVLRQAKRRRWEKLEKERIKQEIELQTYLSNLVLQDKKKKLLETKKGKKSGDGSDQNSSIEKVEDKYAKRLHELNQMFAQTDERRKMRDVPDYLCGKISFAIMKEPVITPSGITYDRKDIEEHLQRVGHFDPVTRNELQVNQLVPNLAMREVITSFVDQNEWVEDF